MHILTNFHSTQNETTMIVDRSLDLTCPGLAEPNSQFACVSAGRCLKFCDDTPSVATPPTLNKLDLDLGCLAASFIKILS